MLALDVSASLGASDIPPSRMVAARNAAADFLAERLNDRVGVILFSGVIF
jgi:Ca-activated chloride channel family protein